MTDLVCLVADNSMQAAVSELLDRPHALGIRSITKEIPVHRERDSGCCYAPMKVLRAYRGSAKHALIILDHDWDGVPETTGAELESFIEERLERDGIEGWAVPVVIDPELEAWVFSDSPHVDKVLGWTNRNPTLREALEQQKLWGPKDSKPADPKAALEWVLKTAGRRPISSAYFRNLARRVSTKRCQDRAFLRFRKLLQDWLPPDSSFNGNPGFDHPSGDGTNIVGHKVKTGKKLIEVALPLDAINAASVREKSIRHGHPSTLHLWWARRPLAAARAVIFSQMVDDPSAHPDRFPTEQAQTQERERLFGLIEKLVKWENTNDAKVLEQAREEIRESWLRTCIDNADHPRAAERFDPDRLPAFHDPFAGGGALPLEAQRLGRGPCLGPQPGGGAHQQGDDRDPAPLRRHAAGEPGRPGRVRARRPVERQGRAGVGGGRALLRPVDARRSREADRASVPEDRSDRGDGGGASRPQGVRGAEAHGDRVAVGAHGEEPEPGVRAGGRAVGLDLHAVDEEGEGGMGRAGGRGRRLPLHGEGRRPGSQGFPRPRALKPTPLGTRASCPYKGRSWAVARTSVA